MINRGLKSMFRMDVEDRSGKLTDEEWQSVVNQCLPLHVKDNGNYTTRDVLAACVRTAKKAIKRRGKNGDV